MSSSVWVSLKLTLFFWKANVSRNEPQRTHALISSFVNFNQSEQNSDKNRSQKYSGQTVNLHPSQNPQKKKKNGNLRFLANQYRLDHIIAHANHKYTNHR